MGNHYHLLLRTPNSNLSRAMRHLDGVYTQRFNQLEKRDGPLFRGRYKSILIDANSYLLQVSRYIHLNPVVANIVALPQDYIWSSYSFFLNLSQRPSWLYCDFTLLQLSKNNSLAHYKQFVEADIGQEPMIGLSEGHSLSILGDSGFIEIIKKKELNKTAIDCEVPAAKILKPNIQEILEKICTEFNLATEDLKKPSHYTSMNLYRDLIIFYLSSYCDFSHQVIAEAMGKIKANSVSKLKSRMNLMVKDNILLQGYIEKIKQILGMA